MTRTPASIPVDLKNPGQVLACVGFLEAAEVLLGSVEAHFDWSDTTVQFVLATDGDGNPFEVVLEFLAIAKIVELTPIGYVEGGGANGDVKEDGFPEESDEQKGGEVDGAGEHASKTAKRVTALAFPAAEANRSTLPLQLVSGDTVLAVSHWADGSSRNQFKLFAGQASAKGVFLKLAGDETKGLRSLWRNRREQLIASPFSEPQPIHGGTFYFDARRSWTGIDAGFSPDEQGMAVYSSPVVELLAAIGLEHARPDEYETRSVRYGVWGHPLPPMLARAALSGADLKIPTRRFEFELDLSGKNKVTTFAQEETQQ